jgi:hypothetical protein
MTHRLLRCKEGTNEIHDDTGKCTHVVMPFDLFDANRDFLAAAPADLGSAVSAGVQGREGGVMGEFADMRLDGTACEACGVILGDAVGYVRYCKNCQRERLSQRLGDRAKKPIDIENVGIPHLREEP